MSYAIQLKKVNGEVVVDAVSGLDNVPDSIYISGHTVQEGEQGQQSYSLTIDNGTPQAVSVSGYRSIDNRETDSE